MLHEVVVEAESGVGGWGCNNPHAHSFDAHILWK